MSADPLNTYRDKRDFRSTPEPAEDDGSVDWAGARPVFVIQKHDASNLHYDLRLEVDGALKSWAVPKGLSTDPSDKRLALPTEDHPLEYADFEGVIPQEQYGGGTVLIWDRGSYENARQGQEEQDEPPTIAEQVHDGHVLVRLHGQKLRGGYSLIRTGDERWLAVKMDDDQADARRKPTSTEPDSVKTGRSLEQIRKDAQSQ